MCVNILYLPLSILFFGLSFSLYFPIVLIISSTLPPLPPPPCFIQDIPAGVDSVVSCLALDTTDRSLLVAGCADGVVRMYDKREPPPSGWCVCVCVCG